MMVASCCFSYSGRQLICLALVLLLVTPSWSLFDPEQASTIELPSRLDHVQSLDLSVDNPLSLTPTPQEPSLSSCKLSRILQDQQQQHLLHADHSPDEEDPHTFLKVSPLASSLHDPEQGGVARSTEPNSNHYTESYLPSLNVHLATTSSSSPEEIRTALHSSSFSTPSSSQQSTPSFTKTGTTIAGCIVPTQNDGEVIILGADTRSTANQMVANKASVKIHTLVEHQLYACGAGTTADLNYMTRQLQYFLQLQQLYRTSIGNDSIQYCPLNNHNDENDYATPPQLLESTPSTTSIEEACHMIQAQLTKAKGALGVNLIVGGFTSNHKAVLTAIHPHGSRDGNLPYVALGSGGLAALAVLEQRYPSVTTIEDGIQLVTDAIQSGIRNDLGSGSQVDVCILYPDGTCDYRRAHVPEEELVVKQSSLLTEESSNEGIGGGGVNGFGNMAFAIQRQRTIASSKELSTNNDATKEEWKEFLGL